MIAKASGDTFQQCFSVSHFIIIRKYTLCSYIGKRHYTTPLIQRIQFPGGAEYTVKTHCGNIICFLIPFIIHFRIMFSFTNIYTHTNTMQHKINLSPKMLHAFFKEIL